MRGLLKLKARASPYLLVSTTFQIPTSALLIYFAFYFSFLTWPIPLYPLPLPDFLDVLGDFRLL
jgi:hypothetical protein